MKAEEVKQGVKTKVATVLPTTVVAKMLPDSNKPAVRQQLLLSAEDEAKFIAAFNLLDADGNGEIDS